MDDDHPRETPAERANRHFEELLQELRVGQTGVQILFAFLLTVPFQARFAQTDDWQRGALVIALLSSAIAAVLFIAPVSFHRLLFRRRRKAQLVQAASVLATIGLAFLALAIVTSVQLVLDVVAGRTVGLIVAAALAVAITVIWYALPWRLRLAATTRD